MLSRSVADSAWFAQGCIRTADNRRRRSPPPPPPEPTPTRPPPPLLPFLFEPNFAWAPSVPRGFKLQICGPPLAGDHMGTIGGGGGSGHPPPPPLFHYIPGFAGPSLVPIPLSRKLQRTWGGGGGLDALRWRGGCQGGIRFPCRLCRQDQPWRGIVVRTENSCGA